MEPNEIIEKLGLQPHPEGGYYSETYRSEENISHSALNSRYSGPRSHSTCIYYMLTSDTFSSMHRIKSDEIFHFYTGDSLEMLQLFPDGSHTLITIGSDVEAGELPQVVVPRGVWQGTRLKDGGSWALLGTTVAPGFDFDDFETGNRDVLIAQYPACSDLIRLLTR